MIRDGLSGQGRWKLWLLRPRMHLKQPGTLTYSMEIQF